MPVADFSFGVGTVALARGGHLVFGGADKLDARFDSTGVFSYFTLALHELEAVRCGTKPAEHPR